MGDEVVLAQRFEEQRGRLRAIAFRMLGSGAEAEDAVQEAWIRLSRSDASGVDNLAGWLTTVVARVCLDMLRTRKSRREEALDLDDLDAANPIAGRDEGGSPEDEALLADSMGVALLVVLGALAPAERVAFVLHDMFAVPFEEIAGVIGRSPTAARQLASRARRRVRGAAAPAHDPLRGRRVVDAFLAASRAGDFEALLAVLDPDVVLHADPAAIRAAAGRQAEGAPALAPEVRGAALVAKTFAGRARHAQPALIDGAPGVVWAPGGRPRAVFAFTIDGDRIGAIDVVVDPERIGRMDVVILNE